MEMEMEMDEPAVLQCSEIIDVHSLRSRISDLRDTYGRSKDESKLSPSESDHLLKESAFHVEGKISEFLSEFSDIGTLASTDLDEFLSILKNELNSVDAENAMISNEIEDLERKFREDSNRFESDLESLDCLTKLATLQGSDEKQINGHADFFSHGEEEKELINATKRNNFKMFELSQQIEENKMTLKSLQDLECMFIRFEAIEKIEDLLSGVKVIEYEGNSMRLSLKTYIPDSESLLCRKQLKDLSEPSEHNHELLIEVVDGTMELKNVEIFPDDVYLGEIVDAAKSFRQLSSDMLAVGIRSPVEWLVRRVQERIVLCSLRRLLVKSANKSSSNSIEYLDREETLIAHMVGGVDAFIKISQGWPLSNHALKLISLKSTSRSNDISLSFLCRIEELSNSLDMQVRNNLCNFVDAIQSILKQQARAELEPERSSGN